MTKLILLQLLFVFTNMCMAQQGVTSAGASHSGTNSSITYSVGELAVSSSETQNISLHEGVIHNFLDVILQVEELKHIQMKVYPNPVQSYLEITSSENEEYELILSNVNGEIIEKQSFTRQYTLPFISRKQGTYILQVREIHKQKLNTYTIIKN